MKILCTILILLFPVGCSVYCSSAVKFGKKCTVAEDGNVVPFLHLVTQKGEELNANKETCKQIQD